MAIAIGLLKTLLELTRSRKSGALSISGGGTRARVFVEEGTIVYADEGTIGETLGRILVREKVLTDAQYNAALERMEALTKKGDKAKLGEILIQLGFLTPVQLDAALSAQVRQKVIRAIGWGSSAFRFFECHGGGLDIAARFATPLEPLVLAALRLAPEEHVEELLDLALTRYPELRGDGTEVGGGSRMETLRRIAAFELQPAEHDFALSLDGSRTSADILASTSEVNPTIVLSVLLLTDCLDLHATAKPPRSQEPAREREKLRPLRRVSPSVGMKAARPVMKKKAPSSVRPPAPAEVEQTRNVAARLKQASAARKSLPPSPHDMPTTPPPPPAPSSPKVGELALWSGDGAAPSTPVAPVNRILAEKAFQAGKAFVRANNMKDAAAELARAATLFPAIEYELWATWTAMRADKEGEAKHVPAVKALAEKAIEQDPSLGFAYFVLGHLALRAFDAVRARELFAKARALDPATSSEAKDVRLKNAAKEEEGAPAAKTPAKEDVAEADAPARAEKPAETEEQGPATRPSEHEPIAAARSSSSGEAPAVEADAPASSRRAKTPIPRRNVVIGAGAAALLALVAFLAAGGKNIPTANADAGAATSAAPPPAVSSVPAPAPEPNAISLEEEDDDAAASNDAAVDATKASPEASANAPDTKLDASTFLGDANVAP